MNEFDWIKDIKPIYPNPKVGDVVKCIPGFYNDSFGNMDAHIDLEYGGCGYEDGKVFIVKKILSKERKLCSRLNERSILAGYSQFILWHDGSPYGVYSNAVVPVMGVE